jgi:UDP-glucose 4-epimerase
LKRCVVIGGNGFIGNAVVALLSQTDREVIVLGRSSGIERSLPASCRYVCGDYGNHTILRDLLQPGCEVIHLAYSTVPKTSYGDPVFDLISNLPPSVGLFQEALHAKVSKLVVVSSGGTVYGPAHSLPIDESHPTEPISPYGITKLTIDRYAVMFHRTMDLPVVVVRPANAYGETQRSGSGQGFLAAAIDAILAKREVEIFGVQGTIRDYIHLDDVAHGVIAALENGKSGEVYNIGTGQGSSHSEVIAMLKEIVRPDGFELHCNILPERRFDVPSNVLDSRKLHLASGWTHSIELHEGLRRMWNAFLNRRRAPSKS